MSTYEYQEQLLAKISLIMFLPHRVPEGEGGLEAAAAAYGAQRAAAAPPPQPKAAPAAPAEAASVTEHSFGVDPVKASDLGETKAQREEDVRQQQRQLVISHFFPRKKNRNFCLS